MSRGTSRERVRLQIEMLEGRWAPAVKLTGNFPGIDFATSAAGQPPDTDLAVGPDHVIETVNATLTIFDKATGAVVSRQSFASFFAPVGGGQRMSDPVVVFDELAGRFAVAILEFNFTDQTSFLDVALSNDADPTHGFGLMRRIDIKETIGTEGFFGDFPRFGWNADAYVCDVNMYAFNGPGAYVQVITLDKNDLTAFRTDRSGPADNTLAPATMHGAAPGDPVWFVEENDSPNSLRLVRMANPLSANPSFTDYIVSVPGYQNVTPPKQPNGLAITTNISSDLLSVATRNGVLAAAQNVGQGNVTHARWYEIDLRGGQPSLMQSGEIDRGDGVFTDYPAIDISPTGNLGLTYIESSATEFMSMYVTGRTPADPPGTMQRPVLVQAGQANYSGSREGDYSGIGIDPTDGSFWAATEFSNTVGFRNWATWIAHFEMIPGNGGVNRTAYIATAVDGGGFAPSVRVYDADTGALVRDFLAYNVYFTGGVRVAVADLFHDGNTYVVTAPGPGGGPDIRIFEAATGRLVRSFFAYAPTFTGGVYVAVGDVNGDGVDDIITGADAGGGPHVEVFSGRDGTLLRSFMAYDINFRGGVRVAAGDVDGDGKADIITAPGPGGGPHVKVFSGADGSLIRSFFAYDANFTGGVYVAAGDVDGDGKADIITGAGAGGGPHVKVFSAGTVQIQSFFAYDASFTGGVRVAALTGSDGETRVLTAAGMGGGPHVRVFNDPTKAAVDSFFAFDPNYFGGVYVGGG